jgi:hypothetical protein
MTRPLQINEMRPVSGESLCLNNPSGDAGLEQFAIPVAMGATNQLGRIGTGDDLRDGRLHALKGLKVTARCERVTIFPVGLVRLGMPCAFACTRNQLRGDAVAFIPLWCR